MEDHGSITIDFEALKQSMEAKLCSDSPLSAKCCIFKVPELLRRHKPEAYEPNIVSIGPFHHGSSKLFEPMEKLKQWYLNSLLLRTRISLDDLIQGIGNITEFEKRARGYYGESLDHLNQNEFVEMMIIDGCFLLELFKRKWDNYPDSENDPISNMKCMVQYLCHDLLLLENQLPWFVLESLYSLICDRNFPLTVLVFNFFGTLSSMFRYCIDYLKHPHDEEILHILDVIRSAIVVPFHKFGSTKGNMYENTMPHATALSDAGIEFSKSSADGLMSIDFKDGVLTIPQLAVAELSEPLFRNVIAFEQCYHGRNYEVTSYALLMDNLIASSKDVDFLCDKQIIHNWLSAEEVSQLFCKLHSDTLISGFCYGELCAEVNEYYKAKWNKWLARLKREYLSNPWKITSLVAAFILLVLTLLQTTYTIQQWKFIINHISTLPVY